MKQMRIGLRAFLLVTTLFMLGCDNGMRESEEVGKAVRESQTLQHLDLVCREIAVFNGAIPKIKSLSKKRNTLFYYYRIDESTETVFSNVKQYFLDNGWSFVKENEGLWEHQIEFEKNELWVQVTAGTFGESNYATSCRTNIR